MGTSKSNKTFQNTTDKKWIASAAIYSGRRDPAWTVPKPVAAQLEKIWDSLPPMSEEAPRTIPTLGYRGCTVQDPSQRKWFAYGGMVQLTTSRGAEMRCDKERTFERLLLQSAPQGSLGSAVTL